MILAEVLISPKCASQNNNGISVSPKRIDLLEESCTETESIDDSTSAISDRGDAIDMCHYFNDFDFNDFNNWT